jgi:undecaprenyl-diphosphatase
VSILHAIVLGIVQGLSEFLPISSSGHLILVPELFGWTELTNHPDLNKTFDVALHVGTFVGAAWYFRHDLARYFVAAMQSIRDRSVRTTDQRVAWLLLLSAVPGAVVGALLGSTIEDELGDPILVGAMLIVFGVVLYLADRCAGSRRFETFSRRDAVLMGVAQAVALQPGVSRSGVTISMGRWLRFDREAATRISFLMSLPIIAGAGLYKGAEVAADGGIASNLVAPFLSGMAAAAVSGFLAISVLLRILQTRSFTPFVVYRIMFGVAVVIVFATGLR